MSLQPVCHAVSVRSSRFISTTYSVRFRGKPKFNLRFCKFHGIIQFAGQPPAKRVLASFQGLKSGGRLPYAQGRKITTPPYSAMVNTTRRLFPVRKPKDTPGADWTGSPAPKMAPPKKSQRKTTDYCFMERSTPHYVTILCRSRLQLSLPASQVRRFDVGVLLVVVVDGGLDGILGEHAAVKLDGRQALEGSVSNMSKICDPA